MLKRLAQAAARVEPRRALAFAVIAALTLYAVVYLDPYAALAVAPFFALGCARGKHPLTLLALAAIPGLFILAGSAVKFYVTGQPLVTYDHHFLRENIVILGYNDWRVALALGLTVVGIGFYFKSLLSGRGAFSRFEKRTLLGLGVASLACLVALQGWDQDIPNWEQSFAKPSLRTFIASMRMPRPELHVLSSAQAAQPIHEFSKLGAPAATRPDIFIILQESTFLPENAGATYKPHTIFTAPGGYSGLLHVHTFAGVTWKSEFSVTTQMRPQEFGSDGLYVFYQLEGRIKQSIFTRLKELGYRTVIFYPVPGSFINARNFYASIGADEFYDPQSLGISEGWDWKLPDSKLYEAMLKKLPPSDKPVVAMMLTINQHGPHNEPDPLAEYVSRFKQSDDAYAGFLKALEARGRPAGVMTFGDHQPEFMADRENHALWYSTAYDIRCVNFTCANDVIPDRVGRMLDITLLAPVALEQFGFTLDGFSAFERAQFKSCDDDVSRCPEQARLSVNSAFKQYFE